MGYLGFALMAAAVTCTVLVTTWGGTQYAWSDPVILGTAVGGILAWVLLFLSQSRAVEPLIPLRPFQSRIITMEDISQTRNMIWGVADHIEAIRPDLAKVVVCVDDYLATARPPQTSALKVSLPDPCAQLVQAVNQEAARADLAQAISSARRKIKSLRHN